MIYEDISKEIRALNKNRKTPLKTLHIRETLYEELKGECFAVAGKPKTAIYTPKTFMGLDVEVMKGNGFIQWKLS